MDRINIRAREALETFYPQSAFEQDAARNARGESAVMHGLRILSEPDENGDAAIVRVSQHVAESEPDINTVTLFPQFELATGAFVPDERGEAEERGDSLDMVNARAEDYRAFVDRVLAAARSVNFPDAIGKGEARLVGFRGG